MQPELKRLLRHALAEDMPDGDITTSLMVDSGQLGRARLISKADGIFYGTAVLTGIFSLIDDHTHVKLGVADGASIREGQEIAVIQGALTTILKAERVLLNLIQRLSGIATTTKHYVAALNQPNIAVMDTRKTTPQLRFLEREAVRAGGGVNHRLNLSDQVLIKENHLAAYRQTRTANQLATLISGFRRTHPDIKIEVEIHSLAMLDDYDLSAVDFIMFDNFSLADVKTGVAYCREKGLAADIEVSGNIDLDSIGAYADLPIQRISIGRLTHSVPALDLSLLVDLDSGDGHA